MLLFWSFCFEMVRDFTVLEFMAVLPQPPECSGYGCVIEKKMMVLILAVKGAWSARRRAGCRKLVV